MSVIKQLNRYCVKGLNLHYLAATLLGILIPIFHMKAEAQRNLASCAKAELWEIS